MPDAAGRAAAIIGMAARFPGAPDLDAYRSNLEGGFDAITDVPAGRWDPVYYDPSATGPDRLYCRRGGFVAGPVAFDAVGFGIMPVAAQGAEPDQLLALDVAAHALDDAGYGGAGRTFPRDRAGVVIGRGGYLTPGVARLDQRVRAAEQLVKSLRSLVPGISAAELAAVRAEFQAELGPFGADAAIGLVPNLAASRIANRLDLHGAAYTVDAACASSLVAVDHACRDLADGRADLMITGGVHFCHDPTFWSVFCQLGALSRSERIRPFDRRADGLLIGEGVGLVVLKRVADAVRDGDRIYAVIRGTGVASDGRGASLMNPAVEGQILALRRAWEKADLDPATVGFVEAHGTGTPAGDTAELTTLARFFGPAERERPRAALGSVKSMIGHTMPAAGAAGLIKAALAIHHGVLLPSLHCDEPRAELDATRFRVLAAAEPWDGDGPRRAGVNAFGFGGINAHVVLEAAPGAPRAPRPRARAAIVATAEPADRVLFLTAATPAELAAAIDAAPEGEHIDRAGAGPCRIALFNPTPERRVRARAIAARGVAWRGRDDVWFAPSGLLAEGGRIAFLFPGIDASFQPRVDDVAERFGLPLRMPASTTSLKDLGMGIIAVGRLLDGALRALGVRPDMIAGHSIGEWSGMIASELIPHHDVDTLIERLAPESVDVPGVVFVAAGCGVDKALAAIAGFPDIAVSHDNCPHQVILCGRTESATLAMERLTRAGVLNQKLPFQSGYHSALFADYVGPHQRFLTRLPIVTPSTQLWSATTSAPYPADADDVRALAIDHLVKPVRFRELTLALHAAGARVFVQVGTGSLIGFVTDTLRGVDVLAISANVSTRSGTAQLRRVAAALAVEGAFAALDAITGRAGGTQARERPRNTVAISLDVPLVELRTPLVLPAAGAPRGAEPKPYADEFGSPNERAGLPDGPLSAELARAFRDIAAAQADVAAAFERVDSERSLRAPRETTVRRTISATTHPTLLDHAFYRQPPGWASVPDRYPVVPMTMLIARMMKVARDLVPELLPVGLERVRAYRWLAVAPPVEISMRARWDGEGRVEVAIDGYATGIVEMASAYPVAPARDASPLDGERPPRLAASELYADRWMFHGPAYQGILALSSDANDGIRGTLVSLAAEGGLLDNAGQLLGYWVMEHADVDRLAMPVLLERIRFFAPEPPPGERLECTVRVRHFGPTDVRADVELVHEGRVWARIDGWEDRRFDSDDRVWDVLRYPERNLLAEVHEGAYGLVKQPWRAVASRDLLARRYLGEREREAHAAAGPRRQSEWLLGRMAIKDCVRHLLWQRGHGAIFPVEIEVESAPDGRPLLRGPLAGDLRVSVAHKEGLAVARVVEGRDVGIDIERISPRDAAFEELAFTPEERALLPDGPERDRVATRLWSAKEAAAKSRGTGLEGNPARFVVCDILGDQLLVTTPGDARVRVETRTVEGHIVAWTA